VIKKDKNQIQTVKLKFLWSVAGYSVMDRKTSEGEYIIEELEIYNLNDKIQRYRDG
jgi:hypothetical protein